MLNYTNVLIERCLSDSLRLVVAIDQSNEVVEHWGSQKSGHNSMLNDRIFRCYLMEISPHWEPDVHWNTPISCGITPSLLSSSNNLNPRGWKNHFGVSFAAPSGKGVIAGKCDEGVYKVTGQIVVAPACSIRSPIDFSKSSMRVPIWST